MIASIRIAFGLLALVVVTLLILPAHLVALGTGRFDPAWAPRIFHRVAAHVLGLRINVTGVPDARRPLMLVANHVSWADIVVLSAIAPVSFVAKAEMAGWPLFGQLARLQRSVFVERDRKGRSGRQANEIAARMANGDVIVLFPEGTTADGNFVLPFKTTLFGAASLARGESGAKVFVQPVSIAYTRMHGIPMGRQHRGVIAWVGGAALIPHLLGVFRENAFDVEVRFGGTLTFDASADRKAVARAAEAQVRTMTAAALRGR